MNSPEKVPSSPVASAERVRRRALLRPFAVVALVGTCPLACTSATTTLPIDDICQQMNRDAYEFLPVGNTPIGSFEPGYDKGVDQGAMIIDDDDLTDDYPIYQQGQALYHQMVDSDPDLKAAVDAYEKSDSTSPPGTVPELKDLTDALTAVCVNYSYFNTLPANGVAPLFTSCKDHWDASGDGILGNWPLDAATTSEQDKAMAACGTVLGAPNTNAINFWGPVSQKKTNFKDELANIDGFTYSGITVPLTISEYKTSMDVSQWEGVAFWARNATAKEALAYDSPLVTASPSNPDLKKNIPPHPHAQDGSSQIGIMLQTNDTGAVGLDGAVAFYPDSTCQLEQPDGSFKPGNCFADQAAFDAFNAPLVDDGTGKMTKYGVTDSHGAPGDVPQPFCIDYSPIDAKPGEEAPYRQQCWDGFRYMYEIGYEWKFIFVPFSQMRQAGWGTYANEFRTNQMRSVDIITSAFNSVNMVIDEVAYYRRKPPAATTP